MKHLTFTPFLTPLLSALLVSAAAHADDAVAAPKKHEPTQSELALDHGPRAQVTPAVKRKRVEAAKAAAAASTPADSK